ncbi:MAG: efflux RND transporter periplasmic adaptor subunit [Bacteroidia bacterium]|nr:efflux RND transporter periplasmic adaptor subunit [Bacteroidia bacterium]
MKKTYFIYSLCIGLIACSPRSSSNQDKNLVKLPETVVTLNEKEYQQAGVKIEYPQVRELEYILNVNGYTDVPPQNLVSISAPMGGYIKHTHLIPGMPVRKGEKLAILEDPKFITLQENYLTTKVKLAQLEKELARQTELNQSKATSDKALEQIKTEYTMQKIALQSLSEQLHLLNFNLERLTENTLSRQVEVLSPVNGYVTKVNVNIGKYVQPSEIMFELVDPTDIHIKLSVFEKDIHKIFVGQKLTAYTNKDNQPYSCEIVFIGKELSKDRTLEVHCHCQGLDKNVIPGEYITAQIPVKVQGERLSLSKDAVVQFEGKAYIFLEVDKQKYEMLPIQIDEQQSQWIAIKPHERINTQSKVVSKGAYSLLMKLKNTVEEE